MYYSKKSLGQNFLVDSNIIEKIVKLTNIYNKDVLEIGPGKGALTDKILSCKPKSLVLIEKDDVLANELKIKHKNNKTIKIYNKDILNFNFEIILKKNSIIFGNLPYNISSQILVNIIRFKKWPPKYSDLIFMFQKELSDRIIGEYGTKKYGRLSILSSYRLKVFDKFNVSSNCFFPKPKVESAVLHFKPKKVMLSKIKRIENLEKITNILFSNKRKMINKNIKKIFKNKNFNSSLNLNLKSRPSNLKPEKYYEITEFFERV
tara:strand:- start:1411 stop:2196 length:786 start_codon:yes stop_codon:yes gene_type:complete